MLSTNHFNELRKRFKPLLMLYGHGVSYVNVSIDMVKENTSGWNWMLLSTVMRLKDIMQNPSLNWDWRIVIGREGVDHLQLLSIIPSTYIPSLTKVTPIDVVISNLNAGWSISILCERPELDFRKHVLPNLGVVEWDFFLLGTLVPLDVVEEYEDLFDYTSLSYNQHITFDFVKRRLNKPWNWDVLCKYMICNIEDIVSNPKFKWNYSALLANDFNKGKYFREAYKRVFLHIFVNLIRTKGELVDRRNLPFCIGKYLY
jgi:hypothetical protein